MMITSRTAHRQAVVIYKMRRLRDNLIRASKDMRPGIKKAEIQKRFPKTKTKKQKRENI